MVYSTNTSANNNGDKSSYYATAEPPIASASPISVLEATNITVLMEEGDNSSVSGGNNNKAREGTTAIPTTSASFYPYTTSDRGGEGGYTRHQPTTRGDEYIHPSQQSAYLTVINTRDGEASTNADDAEGTYLWGLIEQRTFQSPQEHFTSTSEWIYLVIAFIFTLGAFGGSLYAFLVLVVWDTNGQVKPFQGLCLTPHDMDHNLCFFSIGQFARGLICLGQVNFGLFCVGQANIALLFGLGQAAIGWGYSLGQVAIGTYVYVGQVAFALYRVNGAQLGFQCLACFFKEKRKGDNKPLVDCSSCGCS